MQTGRWAGSGSRPPNMSPIVTDAIRCATLVLIPARPGPFDVDAANETIEYGGGAHPDAA
jgi:cellulose biosynthesis protein BcsQ